MDIQKIIDDVLKISSSTKVVEFGSDILDRVPVLFSEYFPGKKALVFADMNTWKAAGERVFAEFVKAGVPATTFLMAEKSFHPDPEYIDMVDKALSAEKDAVYVAVGSGVINDLAKLVSFRHGQQYICVATAASVDGYTSSSAIVNDDRGAKINIKVDAPLIVVADSAVLASAPWQMNAAGYADLAAKVSAGAEWMISDLFGTEPVMDDAWHATQDYLKEMLDDPDGIRSGNPESIEKVFLGLTLSGIGMEVAGSSRPASAAEHLYSHYCDMTHHKFNGDFVSHGFQVAVGELTLCAFFDALFEMDLSGIDVDSLVEAWPSLEEEQQRALDIYSDFPVPTLGYEEITKKWQPKEDVREELIRLRDNWPEFRERLKAQVYSFEKMRDLFRRAGAPLCPADIGKTNADFRKMTDYVQLMRWRINLLDLCKRAGIYDTLMDKVFGKGGVWEI